MRSGRRSRTCWPDGRSAARRWSRRRRPADRAAAVGRGAGAAVRVRAQGLLGGSLDAVGISIPFTTFAVVLAQTFVAAPFYVRSARAGIAGVDRDIEDAARVDGATERQVFRWVTASLAGPALAAGAVMSWSRALGEFGATIMFAGNIEGRTQTLPLVVYSEFGGGDLDASVAAASILVLAAFGVLVSVRFLRWGRAPGHPGRL